ncbi:hypothetical protein LMG32289_06160 [Cupriavidus pampae]|uniref:Uncharacterized protein n=2 Tax=Cupriavidus pampae TaxID=659251 RepID=A0ABM8XZQ8_9BURK|nr:hypothetical protein LMG32289_06160 [Cupriavidus pampae]
MDLRNRRNIECLMKLMEVRDVIAAPHIELADRGLNVIFELHAERMLISTAMSIEASDRDSHMRTIASRWRPEHSEGLPMRFFCTDMQLVVSAFLPAGSNAEAWYRIVKLQRRYVESLRHTIDSHPD